MTLEVECHRCGYSWKYTGSSDYYASCPQCKTSVPIGEGPDEKGGGGQKATTGPSPSTDDGDIERLSTRVEELESTASELHDVIETMMTRVTELERRHKAAKTVHDGGMEAAAAGHGGGSEGRRTETQRAGTGAADDTGGSSEADGRNEGRRRDEPGSAVSHEHGRAVERPGSSSREATESGRASRRTAKPRDGEAKGGGQSQGPGPRSGGDTAAGAAAVEPRPDEDGNYDYLCPSCDGPLSGRPDACIHCGTAFTW